MVGGWVVGGGGEGWKEVGVVMGHPVYWNAVNQVLKTRLQDAPVEAE